MDIQSVVKLEPNPNIPEFGPGDTIKVSFKIVEGERERIQVFNGIVIRKRKSGAGANFTVRQILHGIGVERTFPYYSPLLSKVEVVTHGHARRAKLYYLRGLSRKKTRLKIKAR
ncbi:MAG: 50S ribosomal protein L19 [Dehalococcoidia bacterium]